MADERTIAVELVIKTQMSDHDLDDFTDNILQEVKAHLRDDEQIIDSSWEDFEKVITEMDELSDKDKYRYLKMFSEAIEKAYERLPGLPART